MKNELETNIQKINENITILPLNTQNNRDKYKNYIDTKTKEYQKYLDSVISEINGRYQVIMNIKEDPALLVATSKKYDLTKVCYRDKRVDSFSKMGLGQNIYKLKKYYKTDLGAVNATALRICDSFKEVGIILKPNDFDYSTYEHDYMSALLDHKEDTNRLQNIFDSIYWQCPEIIKHIELNFLKLYFKNEKRINAYYSIKYQDNKIKNYLKEYNDNKMTIEIIKHNDSYSLINAFVNQELSVKDFDLVSINKLKDRYLGTNSLDANYDNLLKLEDNLNEYSAYLTFLPIINKIKELYKDKATYKDLFSKKLKDISKKESELAKLNKKLVPSIFNHPTKRSISETQLLISNKIFEMQTLYDELGELRAKDAIYKYISDDSTILDILTILGQNYIFMVNTYKSVDDTLDIKTINNNIEYLYRFIYDDTLSVINNLTITDNKNISQIISDRYRLMGLNIKESDVSAENIDGILKDINNLMMLDDLNRADIKIDDISFVLDVNKKNILKNETKKVDK